MTTRRALRLMKLLTLAATISALVFSATSLAACTVSLAGPDVQQVESAVDVAAAAALDRLPQALQQVAGQINTLDTQLEQARNVQDALPPQSVAAVSGQLQNLVEQAVPADGSTLNGSSQALQFDIQLDPALNLLDSATRGASQLEQALDDSDMVERVAQGLSAPLNDLPDLSENLGALSVHSTGYLFDPTPHLQSFALSVEALQHWAGILSNQFVLPQAADDAPILDLAPYISAVMSFLAGAETNLAQFHTALATFAQAGLLVPDVADATRAGSELAGSLAQSLEVVDNQLTALDVVGPFLQSVQGSALLLQAQQATTSLEPVTVSGQTRQLDMPVAEALDILGRIARNTGRIEQAGQLGDRAAHLAPALGEVAAHREQASAALMQLSATLDELNHALSLQLDQQQVVAHASTLVQAWAIQTASLYPEAVVNFEAVAHLDPRIDELAGLLDQVDLEMQALDSALTAFDEALRATPSLIGAATSHTDTDTGVDQTLLVWEILNALNQTLELDPEQQQAIADAVSLLQAWSVDASNRFPGSISTVDPTLQLESQIGTLTDMLNLTEPQLLMLGSALADVDRALQNAPDLAGLIASQIDAGTDLVPALEAFNLLNQALALDHGQQRAITDAAILMQIWAAEVANRFPETGSTMEPALQLESQIGTLTDMLNLTEPQLLMLGSALADVDRALQNAPDLAGLVAAQFGAGTDLVPALEALNLLHLALALDPGQQRAITDAAALMQTWAADIASRFPETASTMEPGLQLGSQIGTLAGMLSLAEPQLLMLGSALADVDRALQNAPNLSGLVASQIDAGTNLVPALEAFNLLNQALALDPGQQRAITDTAALMQTWAADVANRFPETVSTMEPALQLGSQIGTFAGMLNLTEPQLLMLGSALADVDQALQNAPDLAGLVVSQVGAGTNLAPALEALNLLHLALELDPGQQQAITDAASLMQIWAADIANQFPETVSTMEPGSQLGSQIGTLAGMLNLAEPQVLMLNSALTDVDRALRNAPDLAGLVAAQVNAGTELIQALDTLNLLSQTLELDPGQQRAIADAAALVLDASGLFPAAIPSPAPAWQLGPQMGTFAGILTQTDLGTQRLNEALSVLDQALQRTPELVDGVDLQLNAASNLILLLQTPEFANRTALAAPEYIQALAGSSANLEAWAGNLVGLMPGPQGDLGLAAALDPQLATAFGFLERAQTHMLRLNSALANLEAAAQQASLLAGTAPGTDVLVDMVAGSLGTAEQTAQAIRSGAEAVAALDFVVGTSQVPDPVRILGMAPWLAEGIGRQASTAGELIRPLSTPDEPLHLQAAPRLVGMLRSVSATSAFAQGWAYELAGRYPEAETGYSQALQFNPELTWALSARGRVKWYLGQLEAALADLNHVLQIDPNLAEAYRLRGHVYRELNQPLQAVRNYDEALRLSPEDAATLIGRGELHVLLGQPLLAIRDYTEAIRFAPRSAIAFHNRGQVFRDLGQSQQALADFSNAIRFRPLYAPAYNARGAVLESLLRYQEALDDLNEAVRLAPDMADAFHNRGTVYLKLEQMQQALDDFNRALELNPNFAVAYNSRGTILLQLGKAMEALADFDAAIRLQPDFGPALRNRGTAYQTTGRLQEAVSDYSRAIELEPNEPITYIYRASVYDQMGRPRDAVADFSEALVLDPDQAPVFYDRGVLQQELGRLQDALHDFDQAIRLEPNFTVAYHDRANVQAGLGRLQDALADFSAAIRLDPDFLAAYLNRARLHLELQLYVEAVQDFGEAIRLDPDLFEAHYQRGVIRHLQFGQLEEAAADFTEAIRIKPDHADAHNYRGEVQAALGNPYDAWHDFDEALRLEPRHTAALYNRGLVFLELDRPRDALDDFDAVDRLAPGQSTLHHHRGQAREALGFLGAALDDYHAAIRLDPDYTAAYFRRGQVLQQFNRLTEALQDYTAAIRLDPELAAAWFRRSEVLTALELPVPALSDLAMVIRLDPSHIQAWFNRGVLRQERGDTARALADYTEALRLDPDLAAAYRNRSAIHLENARLPEALSDLNSLIELAPAEATAYYTRGDVHKTLDNPEEALRDYDQAVRLGIEETLLYYNRGAVKVVLGLTREAVEDFTAALQLTPDHVPALHSRARAHQALGNPEPALADLTEVIRLDPTNAVAFNDRGMAQQELQMPNAAIADFDEAVWLDPTYALAFHNRAFVKLSVRRYRNAITDFTSALELEPDYASAFHGRGSAWWALVDHTKALADFNEAIRLNPTEADAFGQRGQVFLYMGLFDEALADFDRAIELNPESARTYCDRGVVYRFLGKSEAALADFNATLNLKPYSYFALYYRANTLRDLDDPVAALDAYSRAVRLNPNFTHAFSRRSATYKELGQLPQALSDIDMAIQLNPGDPSFYGERGLIRSALGQMDLARADFQDAYCRFQQAGTSSGMDWIRSLAPDVAVEAVCD